VKLRSTPDRELLHLGKNIVWNRTLRNRQLLATYIDFNDLKFFVFTFGFIRRFVLFRRIVICLFIGRFDTGLFVCGFLGLTVLG
jgi:hypothetical protein